MEGLLVYPFIKQPSTIPIKLEENNHGANYIAFASVLLFPFLVGIIYSKWTSFRRRKSDLFEPNFRAVSSYKYNEFIGGNQGNSAFIVGVSFFTGFLSSISIIGYPFELIEHGIQPFLFILLLIPIALVHNYLFVPVYFNMELSSPYEYYERRFSRSVRIFVGILSWIQMIAYMSLVVYGTSFWLESLTKLDMRIWSGFLVVFAVCTCYLASYNSLQWICSTQAVAALALVISLLTFGILQVNDYTSLWNLWIRNDKLNFYNFDLNPGSNYTIWTSTFGSTFLWFSFYSSNYVQLQRIISVKETKSGKRSVLLGTFITIIFLVILILIALLALGQYCGDTEIQNGESIINFLSSYYIKLLQILPGLYGFFLAALISLSLSNLSSHLKSTVALMTYDYLKYWIPDLSCQTEMMLSRLLLIFVGILVFSISIVFSAIYNNNVPEIQLILLICAITCTPIIGVLSLGLFFPFSNSKGSIIGMISSIALITYIMIFSGIYNLEQISNQNNFECVVFNSSTHNVKQLPVAAKPNELFSLSHFWYPAVSFVTTVFSGLMFSLIFIKFEKKISVSPECLSPPILKLWLKWLPPSISRLWIDPDEHLSLISSSVWAFIPRSLEGNHDKDTSSPTNCGIDIRPVYTNAKYQIHKDSNDSVFSSTM